jgi:hypothetical protein
MKISITSEIRAKLAQDGTLTLSASDEMSGFALQSWYRLYKHGKTKLNVEIKVEDGFEEAVEKLAKNAREFNAYMEQKKIEGKATDKDVADVTSLVAIAKLP